MYSSAARAYRTVRVESASPARVLEEVFERIELDCELPRTAIQDENLADRCKALSHALKLVGALEASLDEELAPELCGNLKRLYGYVRTQLVDANVSAEVPSLDNAVQVIRDIHESFRAAQGAG